MSADGGGHSHVRYGNMSWEGQIIEENGELSYVAEITFTMGYRRSSFINCYDIDLLITACSGPNNLPIKGDIVTDTYYIEITDFGDGTRFES